MQKSLTTAVRAFAPAAPTQKKSVAMVLVLETKNTSVTSKISTSTTAPTHLPHAIGVSVRLTIGVSTKLNAQLITAVLPQEGLQPLSPM